MPAPEVRDAARRAEASPMFETLARSGLVADGAVHVLVGIFAVVVAIGRDSEADQSGALRTVAEAPLGFVVLWLAALALGALGVWQVLDGLLARRGSRRRTWMARATEWGRAAAFLALAVFAGAVAVGARPDPDQSVQHASRDLLVVPGGPFVLGAIGVAVGLVGAGFAAAGVMRRFARELDAPPGRAGATVVGLGVTGYVAKGVALVTVCVLLVVAAVRIEPEDAGGLDAALDGLVVLPFGRLVCASIGVGLVAYGVYLVLAARYRRI